MWVGWRVGVVGVALLLAGCEQPEVHQTIAGLNAFRAGDQAALEKAQAALAKLNPDPATSRAPCTAADFSYRRLKAFSDLLSFLGAPSDGSESENVRFFRLQGTFGVVITDDLPPLDCPPSADRDQLVMTDRVERLAVADAEHGILTPWAARLGHIRFADGPNLEFEGVTAPVNP